MTNNVGRGWPILLPTNVPLDSSPSNRFQVGPLGNREALVALEGFLFDLLLVHVRFSTVVCIAALTHT